ncbi:hypothetical protein FDI69_gp225 [Rhodococcus phage Trina]|uniref:Uncharacterized protein n=1 Tax=Rhodococcus phage Trina TaxID=2027905 RepID=A0A2D0ZN27_9CAUD|nr:hypothetical protein FDI69_gp225 [Rhodococcus phage Trina]ASZ74961.1 hypothetical protein SEA_TRINA_173 [Rhodococcus phage Trina]
MQFKITYVRPGQRRFSSGWTKAESAGYRETLLYTYEDKGFKSTKLEENKIILSHSDLGVRVIEFKD